MLCVLCVAAAWGCGPVPPLLAVAAAAAAVAVGGVRSWPQAKLWKPLCIHQWLSLLRSLRRSMVPLRPNLPVTEGFEAVGTQRKVEGLEMVFAGAKREVDFGTPFSHCDFSDGVSKTGDCINPFMTAFPTGF